MNANLLKSRMALCNLTQAEVAKACEMTENTLSNKINGRSEFHADEIVKICDLLQISDSQMKVDIFLTNPSQ